MKRTEKFRCPICEKMKSDGVRRRWDGDKDSHHMMVCKKCDPLKHSFKTIIDALNYAEEMRDEEDEWKPRPTQLVTRSIRFDDTDLSQAQAAKVDISEVCRKAVREAIMQAQGKCPTCGKKK